MEGLLLWPWKETVRPEVGHWCWNGKRRWIRDILEVDSVSLGALLGVGGEGDEGVKDSCCVCGEVVGALRQGRSQEKGVWLGQLSGCPFGVVRWHWGLADLGNLCAGKRKGRSSRAGNC